MLILATPGTYHPVNKCVCSYIRNISWSVWANMCMYISLCVGESRGTAGQYILYCPLQWDMLSSAGGNVQILPGRIVSSNPLSHSVLINPYIVSPIGFDCGFQYTITKTL